MAVEYDGGVIIGADSRTSTGYVQKVTFRAIQCHFADPMWLTELQISSHQ